MTTPEDRKLVHDLKNMLSAILMHSQLLSQYTKTDIDADEIKKSAAAIEQSVMEMDRLLDQ